MSTVYGHGDGRKSLEAVVCTQRSLPNLGRMNLARRSSHGGARARKNYSLHGSGKSQTERTRVVPKREQPGNRFKLVHKGREAYEEEGRLDTRRRET